MQDGNDWRSTDRRSLLKALGVSAGTAALAGCSGQDPTETDAGATGSTSATEAIPEGGDLVVTLGDDPENLDEHTTTNATAQKVLGNVTEGLFGLARDTSLTHALTTDHTVGDDGKTYEMSLKEGVKFHDGSTMTSADVKYSFERILSLEESRQKSDFEIIDTIETPDDHTVRFVLSDKQVTFLLAMAESAAIIPEGSADSTDLAQNPIGTGPFELESWETDDRVVLSRFEDYHREDLPHLDSVTFDIIPEGATGLTQLENGEVNAVLGVPFQKASEVADAQNTRLESVSDLWVQAMWYNLGRDSVGDPRVRRAISHAIDREQLVQGALFGRGEVAHSPAPPVSAWSDRIEDEPHGYSEEKAKSLLDEAGVDPGSLEITIRAMRSSPYGETATLVQAMLSRLGVNAETKITDFGTWIDKAWLGSDYDLSIGSFSGRVDPDGWYYRQYHSGGAFNISGYANDEVDALLEEGRTTTDQGERAEIYSEIETILSRDAPMVYLYSKEDMTGLTNDVGGYELTPTSQADFDDVYLK